MIGMENSRGGRSYWADVVRPLVGFIRSKFEAGVPMPVNDERLRKIAEENAEEINRVFKDIQDKEKKALILKNPAGDKIACTFRFSVGRDVKTSDWSGPTKIVGRWEIFEGDAPEEVGYSIEKGKVGSYEIREDGIKHPVAFREMWYSPSPKKVGKDSEIDLVGFVHTHDSWGGVGLSSALVEECAKSSTLRDFVLRNSKDLADLGVSSMDHVNLFIYDHSYLLPNIGKNRGWSERIAAKLGFNAIKREEYENAMSEGFVKRIEIS